ncbi:MAG: carboxylating nicotinate-nucleotide diphosphorylase [Nitrospinota bacterium]|nr:carboxylating nicotinate-nucleotide diphosphorylase [Nitrospinota bacterium]
MRNKRPPGIFEPGKIPTRAPVDREAIRRALAEDAPGGDITARLTVPENAMAKANLVAKQELTAAGLAIFKAVFTEVDSAIRVSLKTQDGARAKKGEVMAQVTGPARAVLTAERVALNFLIRACSVATITASYAEAVRGTGAVILDTRKTTPGLRDLEKYSVLCGGGANHRRDLSSMVLIKENHIAIAGGVAQAMAMAKKGSPKRYVEIEVENLHQLEEALAAGADMALLDNMSPAMMEKAVRQNKGRALLEASGNMTLKRAARAAKTGVDFISVGALTHSAPAVDLSLLVQVARR